jgi:SAM-dependent methyltransferase
MHGKPFHAPVTKPKRILDIGCGTGAMTAWLARKYPDAEVIGIDISPVPKRHQQPDNLTYVQGNIMELVKNSDSRFAAGSFDYVFHRLLVFALTDWPAYVSVVQSLLRPGGWAEMQDMDSRFLDAEGNSFGEKWWFYSIFIEDCEVVGLDTHVGSKLAAHMGGAGSLKNVRETVYKLPLVPTPDLPEAELYAKLMEKNVGTANQALVKRVCGPRRNAEVVEKMSADMIKEFSKLKAGDHSRIFVAVGQKSD